MPIVLILLIFVIGIWADASFLRQDCGLGIKLACDKITAKYEEPKP